MEVKINGMKLRRISTAVLLLIGTSMVHSVQAVGLASAAVESAADLLRDDIAQSKQLVDDLYVMTGEGLELSALASSQLRLQEFMSMSNEEKQRIVEGLKAGSSTAASAELET